jgi:hypothetical protein
MVPRTVGIDTMQQINSNSVRENRRRNNSQKKSEAQPPHVKLQMSITQHESHLRRSQALGYNQPSWIASHLLRAIEARGSHFFTLWPTPHWQHIITRQAVSQML